MKSPFLFLALAFLLFSFGYKAESSLFPKEKSVGIYDLDSVHACNPRYHAALDSAASYRKSLDYQLASMESELAEKKKAFANDSAAMTPVVREVRKKELEQMAINVDLLKTNADTDFQNYKAHLLDPFDRQLEAAAENVRKKKRIEAVIDKKKLNSYTLLHSEPFKTVSVTSDICSQFVYSR